MSQKTSGTCPKLVICQWYSDGISVRTTAFVRLDYVRENSVVADMEELRVRLLDKLRSFSRSFPGMRICQLVDWPASSAGFSKKGLFNLNDHTLYLSVVEADNLPCCREQHRCENQKREPVFEVLAEFGQIYPDWSLVYLLLNLAKWGGEERPWFDFYYIEDDTLLAGARIPESERIAIVPPLSCTDSNEHE